MAGVLENYVLPVVCAKCGAQIQKTIGVVSGKHEISCSCGTAIYLVTDELVRIIDELEGADRPSNTTGPLRSQGNRDQENPNSIVTGPLWA
jgi:hypothetical protein